MLIGCVELSRSVANRSVLSQKHWGLVRRQCTTRWLRVFSVAMRLKVWLESFVYRIRISQIFFFQIDTPIKCIKEKRQNAADILPRQLRCLFYLVFLPGVWDKALPAAVLLLALVRLSRRTDEAALAARLLVCLELAIASPPTICRIGSPENQRQYSIYSGGCQ